MKVKRMEKLEERREGFKKELDEIALASEVHSSDLKRFDLFEKSFKDAEEEANKCWTIKK